MALQRGARLGAYEILAPLGAGGMGEVYRARDTKLDRDVALKVLSERLADDPQALARFEREAKAVAALSHPNILSIFDFGTQDGTTYAVMELLEGGTLRESLSTGALPVRKAVEYAVQIANGLAAAHEKGIVHRDLKPENVFAMSDGRVKILDFGLARHMPASVAGGDTRSPTFSRHTDPGTVLGTASYMSPEQVKGLPTDHRSDIFSFGLVLYELLSGRRAFARETAAETMTAILKEDPPELAALAPDIPAALARIVQHCLEKNPAERFQSTRDLAFDLASLSGPATTSGARIGDGPGQLRAWGSPRRWAATTALAMLAAMGGYLVARQTQQPVSPSFRPLTFRRGHVTSARFMPDGQTVVYGAMWDGSPVQTFTTRLGSSESSPLSFPPGDVLAVSRSGELLLSLGRRFTEWFITSGRLARAPLSGGAPRELLEDIQEADWSPDGQLLVVRHVKGRCRLELAGSVLYETPGWISHARMSPRGDLVAFLDHGFRGGDNGSVAVLSSSGKGEKKTLTSEWSSVWGLAWSPRGDEIWFTGARSGWHSALYAATPAGRLRQVLRVPGKLQLHDIDDRGHLLVSSESIRVGALYSSVAGDERDLSWLAASVPVSLSMDGRKLVINEQGEGTGERYGLYLRDTDGSPALRLGDGFLGALSPDASHVATATMEEPSRLAILPTGAGDTRLLPALARRPWAIAWFADGKRLAFAGFENDRGPRLYVQDLSSDTPRPFTSEGFGTTLYLAVSPDGRWAAAVGPERKPFLCPVDGGEPVPLQDLQAGDSPLRFSADGRWLYLSRPGETSAQILRFDVMRRKAELWREFRPRDPHGIIFTFPTDVTPDGRHGVYGYFQILSSLFLVEDLR